jgi:hypothetical protein
VIFDFTHARLMRTIGATVECIIGFDAVPDDLTAAMVTDRGEFVNRALEAVKRMLRASSNHLEG